MRFTQFRGGFHCSLQNCNYICLRNFPSFRATTCICWLSYKSSMQCKIRNKFVKLRKFLNVENFSATTIGQAPVQTKNMIEKYYIIFWFLQKKRRWLFFWDYFFAESAKWSLVIGRFLRWINFLCKLNSCEIWGKLVLLLALKTKIYRNFANWQQFLLNFLKFSIFLTYQKFE